MLVVTSFNICVLLYYNYHGFCKSCLDYKFITNEHIDFIRLFIQNILRIFVGPIGSLMILITKCFKF